MNRGSRNPMDRGSRNHRLLSLAGYSPWDRKELDITEVTKHAHMGLENCDYLYTLFAKIPGTISTQIVFQISRKFYSLKLCTFYDAHLILSVFFAFRMQTSFYEKYYNGFEEITII